MSKRLVAYGHGWRQFDSASVHVLIQVLRLEAQHKPDCDPWGSAVAGFVLLHQTDRCPAIVLLVGIVFVEILELAFARLVHRAGVDSW